MFPLGPNCDEIVVRSIGNSNSSPTDTVHIV